MSIGFSVGFAVITLFIIGTMFLITNRIITQKIGTMAGEMNEQFRDQLNSTIDTIENMALYLYSSPEFYQYDPTVKSIGEYDRLVSETNLSSFLYNLGVMGEYADLGVIYRNGKICGRISESSRNLFGAEMFSQLENELLKAEDDDVWVTGFKDSFTKIYYLKRLNKNGIFILSVYTTNLSEHLTKSQHDRNLMIHVINGEGQIVFGTQMNTTGTSVSVENRNRVYTNGIGSYRTSTQLVLVDQCSNGWYVVSTGLTKDIFHERDQLLSLVIILFFFALAVIVIFCIVFSLKLTIPVELLVKKLDLQSNLDIQTKLFHRDSFSQFINMGLQSHPEQNGALMLIDIDNFKKLNTDYGHQTADKVIIEVIETIREIFPQNAVAGRTGGDEFCVYVPLAGQTDHAILSDIAGRYLDQVHDRTESHLGINTLTCSIGISVYPDQGKDFDLLFTLADKALAAAKENGKNQSHIYDMTKDFNRWSNNQEF